nr:L-serine ammonia-lyase, iron-sulfur-dependent subunit beta [bacterium]
MHTSLFQVLGPVMIGPSSSHTAGAIKLGRAGYMLCGGHVASAIFYLHGSFAKTGLGHGTDKALVAGVLGMKTDDERMKHSFEIARQQGVSFSFQEKEIPGAHPNTVLMELTDAQGVTVTLQGQSIGAGEVEITRIDGVECLLTGDYPGVVISHMDHPGVISNITGIIARGGGNIVSLRHARRARGDLACTILETDAPVPGEDVEAIRALPYIRSVQSMQRL